MSLPDGQPISGIPDAIIPQNCFSDNDKTQGQFTIEQYSEGLINEFKNYTSESLLDQAQKSENFLKKLMQEKLALPDYFKNLLFQAEEKNKTLFIVTQRTLDLIRAELKQRNVELLPAESRLVPLHPQAVMGEHKRARPETPLCATNTEAPLCDNPMIMEL